MSASRRKASTGPIPMLHDLRVTLASDARIDTLLEHAAGTDEKLDTLAAALTTVVEQGAEGRLRVETVQADVAVLRVEMSDALRMLRRILKMEREEMVKLADLQSAVAEQTSVTQSVVTLVDELAGKLQSALDNGSDEEIQAVIDQMKSNSAALASAVSANTPAPVEDADGGGEPAPVDPAPEPAPVDPAPEPAPEEPAPAPEPDPNA